MHIPTSLALTLSFLKARQAFETYDTCAATCFYEMASSYASSCTGTIDSTGWITCICQDTEFSDASAGCIAKDCGAATLNDTATKHAYNCNLNGSPPTVDAAQFIAAGDKSLGITTSVAVATSVYIPAETATSDSYSIPTNAGNEGITPTTTKSSAQETTIQTSSSPATSSSSSSSNDGSNTLSTGALVGSIVGSITGAIGSFAGVYFAYKTYKIKKEEKKAKEESEGQGQVVGD